MMLSTVKAFGIKSRGGVQKLIRSNSVRSESLKTTGLILSLR